MSNWTSKPSPDYTNIESEFEASLRRAFVDGHADYIVLYDRRERFLWESVWYAQEQGWLNDGKLLSDADEQSSEARFRLTAKGREHFGLAV